MSLSKPCVPQNILMDKGEKGLNIRYYMYRVEFQARGMPHIHGCAWLQGHVIKGYFKEGTFEYKVDKLPKLIDTMISCELPEDERKLHRI